MSARLATDVPRAALPVAARGRRPAKSGLGAEQHQGRRSSRRRAVSDGSRRAQAAGFGLGFRAARGTGRRPRLGGPPLRSWGERDWRVGRGRLLVGGERAVGDRRRLVTDRARALPRLARRLRRQGRGALGLRTPACPRRRRLGLRDRFGRSPPPARIRCPPAVVQAMRHRRPAVARGRRSPESPHSHRSFRPAPNRPARRPANR